MAPSANFINSRYFAFCTEFCISLLTNYVTVVEDRLIMSVNIVSQFQSSTCGHNYPTLQRGLPAIGELLVINCNQFIYYFNCTALRSILCFMFY